ncbi:hypothetical protein NVP1017O_28 [Vibrio phage 1.017.O._10N.286.55.C11]|nr:hypothetical protein NVP1017O_28 [Vibrio phage 1.017.O._10N.286.55.C11]AUR85460.1 hypothetical protein NVP1075O_28 [Vibrio phage 1.075.O._10N.286.55.B10]AUR87006.1 hypothetical protein NVP1093O_28 [Vibrio phage 1.093.O._10N.286.55.E10]AUR87079.1 hypothetical protein NVP1094O_28 [Vibrio phage 1.094.O._10N.286.55.E12]
MKLTDISNNKAKEIIEGAPKEATHFSCIEGKTQYYKNETVISSLDEVFINVFRDIFQPSVFLLSDLENKMNIDKVETQSPEEKEVLDSINQKDNCEFDTKYDHWHGKLEESINDGSLENAVKEALDQINNTAAQVESLCDYQKNTQTEHQEEMSALSGEFEWNGEGLPPVGEVCEYKDGDNWYEVRVKYLSEWFMVIEALKSQSKWIDIKGTELSFEYSRFDSLKFRKPETPQQREGRERLEAAYDLYCIMCGIEGYAKFDLTDFSKTKKDSAVWLAIVDKTNYRKGVK